MNSGHWTSARHAFKKAIMVLKMEYGVLSTKERSYIIGLFLGDGYASYSPKDRHYRVGFCLNSVKDKDILNFVKSLLEKVGYNCFEVKDKRYNLIYLFVNSKSFYQYMVRKKATFKAGKIVRNRSQILGLLSGLIDSEGYVGHGEIFLAQKDDSIAKLMWSLSDSLKLTKKVKKVPNAKGSPIWRIRISTKFKTFSHISQKVKREYKQCF